MVLRTNKKQINEIKEWIRAKTEPNCSKLGFDDMIFVIGNSGIGKSHTIKEICKELDLFTTFVSTDICYSSSDLIDHIMKASSASLIQSFTNTKQKNILVIDDFDSIAIIDRTVNTSLINLLSLQKCKRIPIICISSREVMKRVGSIKNKCKVIIFDNPCFEDVYSILSQRFPDYKNLYQVVEKNNGNISQCLHQIEYGDIFIFDNMDDLICVNILYGNEYNRSKITNTVLTDPWVVPLRFHENMLIELKNRKLTIQKCNILYSTFLKRFIYYDMLLYGTNTSPFIVDFFTSIIYDFLNLQNKKGKRSNVANFTKILSFISLQKKNIKRSYTNNFPLYQINKYHVNNTRNFISFN